MAAVVSVKEAIRYLAHFLSEGPAQGFLEIEPETIRRAKLNDSGVSEALLNNICCLIGFLNKFRMASHASAEDKRKVLALYLSIRGNPFEIEINGHKHFDLNSARSLLKIFAWLLFSAEDVLGKLDHMLITEVLSLEKIRSTLLESLQKKREPQTDKTQPTQLKNPSEDPKQPASNVIKVPGQKYSQLAPLKDRNLGTLTHNLIENTTFDVSQPKSSDKSSQQVDNLARIIAIQDTQVLKTMLLLKLDKLLSLSKHHKKLLSRILSSLGNTNTSSVDLGKSEFISLLGMLLSPQETGEIVQNLDDAILRVKSWTKDLSLRKSCIEWLDSLNDEDKKITGTFPLNYEEQELLQQSKAIMRTKYVCFDELYENIDQQLKVLESHADIVKGFGDFWAETSKTLAGGPAEYRKIMTGVIARENAKLIPKYKSQVSDQYKTTYQAQSDHSTEIATLDLFRLLTNHRLGTPDRKMGLKPDSEIQKLKSLHEEKGLGSMDALQNPFKSAADCDKYREFLDEVQDFLAQQNINMIKYRR